MDTKERRDLVAKIGENRDVQHCDTHDLSSELDKGKCYKVSVSSGIPKSGKDAANLLVEWTANGLDEQAGLER
jgi:hypothetical protein